MTETQSEYERAHHFQSKVLIKDYNKKILLVHYEFVSY